MVKNPGMDPSQILRQKRRYFGGLEGPPKLYPQNLCIPKELGGAFSNIFRFSARNLGKISNLTTIFFKWVGSTTNPKKNRIHISLLRKSSFITFDVWGSRNALFHGKICGDIILTKPLKIWNVAEIWRTKLY